MPEDAFGVLKSIFRRGFDTQSIPDTGLGLAIARESLNRMSGTITVESEFGEGTSFIIIINKLLGQIMYEIYLDSWENAICRN
ncbi:MAG: ATP-binding protein [Bacillota bacterium]|nr:ATP-binding protein [Bacillota bacterium]